MEAEVSRKTPRIYVCRHQWKETLAGAGETLHRRLFLVSHAEPSLIADFVFRDKHFLPQLPMVLVVLSTASLWKSMVSGVTT
jgi:hypothetical protein